MRDSYATMTILMSIDGMMVLNGNYLVLLVVFQVVVLLIMLLDGQELLL